MKCPACGHDLTEKKMGEMRPQACEGGCGGIWFDSFGLGLPQMSQEDQAAFEPLLFIRRNRHLLIDPLRPRWCPSCDRILLKRVLFGPGSRASVSECSACGGGWLDDGELAQLHFEWTQKMSGANATESAAATGLIQYLYELRTGHRRS